MTMPTPLPAAFPPIIDMNTTTQQPRSVRRRLVHLLSRQWDGLMALVIVAVAQLLMAGIQYLLDGNSVDLPPSILAMAVVFVGFAVSGYFLPGVDKFYQRRLRCSADLLNRHMSIGFTIPFVMICRSPLADGRTIGLIVLCFVLTGVLNTVFSYFLALPLQCIMVRWDKRSSDHADPGAGVTEGRRGQKLRGPIKSICDVASMDSCLKPSADEASEEAQSEEKHSVSQDEESSPRHNRENTNRPPRWSQSRQWALRNPMLIICWLLTIFVGIPLRYAIHNDAVLSTCLLFSIWLSLLAIQVGIKSSQRLRPWLRALLCGMFNAVLWTSLAMITYVFVDGAISHRSLPAMLDTLQTNITFSTYVLQAVRGNSLGQSMAAGDIALSILNAGLVSWGLKLYEYRQQLLSRAGLTVFTVSSVVALGNVVCGPLLAYVVGLGPASRDLAFAARSVTLALGSPVMTRLGGDISLNATMVVVSGIVYQMGLGFGVGVWLEQKIISVSRRRTVIRTGESLQQQQQQQQQEVCAAAASPAAALQAAPGATTTTSTSSTTPRVDYDTEAQQKSAAAATVGSARAGSCSAAFRRDTDDPCQVAAGITIGINAAAMGTAYLYETKSDAAPFAALSMIALGVMTVVFSTIQPIAHWIVAKVATGDLA
ncbi:hypothetical protein B0T24DRAFT_361094 [Lasiosphaeria ovina]|uniref:LrgB-like protein n=1 Tax=Lasiosphaeria ovina TaxID=92902 RepID=A0AAE0K3U4_9PEZI|nr:hypothetical protein B0T24DRAFT_361094 [Lasiosphaeria ovina]